MKKVLLAFCIVSSCFTLACSKKGVTPPPPQTDTTYKPSVVSASFAKGADISWVTQFEASGVKFYNKNGSQQDLFALIKSLGFNSIRLRAFVNPSDGWCNTADVVAKAIRAKNAGMKIMIDFHYSDVWADPGHQTKPAAWASLDFPTLLTTMYNYTTGVMTALKTNGITPDWVQVGNETSDGMLWEDGRASTKMANFAALIKNGYSAVKSVSSTTKVIVHIANGYDNSLFEWIFDGLKANGAQWDIIGMSLYPSYSNSGWQTIDNECLSNINALISRYSTPVMVVEVGMPASPASTARDFLTDIIKKANSVSGGNGLGVFYWEPEAYNNGYGLGAFDSTGKPAEALDAFGN
ncbi:MAG TPA: glycosyl hydrolase 53 family protein [Mucilaginibacter sp.]